MNAAFLLVASAWLAGGEPPPSTTPTPPAPQAAPAPAPYGGGSCGCGCASTCGCNEGEKPGFFDRLRGRFHRDHGDCGCTPAPCQCAPAPVYHAAPCACSSPCDTCERPSLFERLRGRFHRGGECGCGDTCGSPGCSSCGGGAPLPPQKPGEQLKPPMEGPKKLPEGTDKKETTLPRSLELTPTAGDKIIESGTKNPF